jgi:two-component system nitrate/nitrite response regulator NarL
MKPHSQPLIRVLIIDAHTITREGLALVIETQPGLRVVGGAGNRSEALELTTREQPDVILLELDLGNSSGLDLLPELLAVAPAARILILTGVHDPEQHRHAVRLGAVGLVLKEKSVEMLFKAIEKVYAGEVWLERAMLTTVLNELTHSNGHKPINPEEAKVTTLTAREREVITLVGQGLRNKEVAKRLFISETTVRHHLTSIFAKLNLSDRLELVIYSYRYRLAKVPF